MTDADDQLIWKDGSDKMAVNECSRQIFICRQGFFSHDEFIFDWDKVWVQVVPSKISFLAWLVVRDGVLTHANLQQRGFKWVSKCFMCGMETEDIQHMFVSCCFVKQLWSYFCKRNPAFLTRNVTVGDRIKKWVSLVNTDAGAALNRFLPLTLVWRVWEERNRRCFDELNSSMQQALATIKETVWC